MIKRKKKKCRECETEQFLWSDGMCQSCWKASHPYERKKTHVISKVSRKESERRRKYKAIRDAYMNAHKLCERCNQNPSTELHHKRGRVGENLFNHFAALCHPCHVFVENHPLLAKEEGWSENRLN